jgi:protein O-GlcNAc transferase
MQPTSVLRSDVGTTDVLRDRGFAQHERGEFAAAENTYRQVLQRTPDDVEVRCALGVVALQTGRHEMAVELLTAVLALRPTADAHCYLGNALSALSRHNDALENYDRAVALDRGYAPAHINRGHLLRAAGRRQEALAAFDRAIALRPEFFEAILARAEVLCEFEDWAPATAAFEHAIALRPTLTGYLGRGLALRGMNRNEEALLCYEQAAALQPSLAEAWLGSAMALLALARPEESLSFCDRALELKRPYPDAWLVRGAALQELGRTRDAIAAVDSALVEEPGHVDARNGRANMRRAAGDFRGAVADFREVLKFDPGCDMARMGAVIAEIPCIPATVEEADNCREAFRSALAGLAVDLDARPSGDGAALVGSIQPFPLAYQERDNRALLESYGALCAGSMERWRRKSGLGSGRRPARAGSKHRVAVVSAQICDHSVYNAITRGWLEHLDRRRFEIALFHTGGRSDQLTERARTCVEHYAGGRRTLLEWVRAIDYFCPDVILYPEIGMDPASLQLASQRLATVQAASWGHPQTTGLPTMDYFLSADSFEPPEANRDYTERLVRLPNLGCYYEALPPPPGDSAELPADRSGPVLVCAGSPLKYAPEHDQVYVDIARRLGRCQFHFFSFNDGQLTARLEARMAAAFAAAGLDHRRHVVVRPWATAAQFRQFLPSADLMLDTLGFSGFNTVMQALECHLPVLSFRGRFLRGRLGTGILERIALNELIAETPVDYVDRAVALVQDDSGRLRFKDRIRQGLSSLSRDGEAIPAMETFLTEALARA